MRMISTLSLDCIEFRLIGLSFYSPDQFFLRDRAGHLVLRLVRVHLGEGWGGADLKGVLVVHLRQQLFRRISGIWMLEKRALIRTICSTAPSFFLIARISTSSGRRTKVKHRMKLFRSFPRIRNKKRWEAIHVFGKLNALCCFIMMTVNLPLR